MTKHTATEIKLGEHDIGNLFSTISNHIKKTDTLIFVSSRVLESLKKYGAASNIFLLSSEVGENYSLHKDSSWDSETLAVANFITDCKEFYRLEKFWEIKDENLKYLYSNARPGNLIFIDIL